MTSFNYSNITNRIAKVFTPKVQTNGADAKPAVVQPKTPEKTQAQQLTSNMSALEVQAEMNKALGFVRSTQSTPVSIEAKAAAEANLRSKEDPLGFVQQTLSSARQKEVYDSISLDQPQLFEQFDNNLAANSLG